MGPAGVEERNVLVEEGSQLSLPKDDDVVEALAADACAGYFAHPRGQAAQR